MSTFSLGSLLQRHWNGMEVQGGLELTIHQVQIHRTEQPFVPLADEDAIRMGLGETEDSSQ